MRTLRSIDDGPTGDESRLQAIQVIDIPIIMGVTLISAVAIVIGNLIADLIAPLIDPRIKLR